MKFHFLKIVPLLLGLFVVSVSFGSFADSAQAGTTCTDPTPYSCDVVTSSGTLCSPTSFDHDGGCGYDAGTYPAGCYPYTCTAPSTCYTDPVCTTTPDCQGVSDGSISCTDGNAAPYVSSNPIGGTATFTYNSCNEILSTDTSGCEYELSGSKACSDPDVASYVGNLNGSGTVTFTYNSRTFAILSTNTSGCSAPACTQLNGLTHPLCADYAGQYNIPLNYTVGTATWTYNSCSPYAVTYVSGCSAKTVNTFTVSDSSLLLPGGPVTFSWNALGVTSCSIAGDDGTSVSGLSPIGNTSIDVTGVGAHNYNLVCQ